MPCDEHGRVKATGDDDATAADLLKTFCRRVELGASLANLSLALLPVTAAGPSPIVIQTVAHRRHARQGRRRVPAMGAGTGPRGSVGRWGCRPRGGPSGSEARAGQVAGAGEAAPVRVTSARRLSRLGCSAAARDARAGGGRRDPGSAGSRRRCRAACRAATSRTSRA